MALPVQPRLFSNAPMFALVALIANQSALAAVPVCGYQVIRAYPHDPTSFTQGLLFHDGHLYEGTGLYGRSRLARLDLATGRALVQKAYPPDQFGEGVTRWKGQLISLTWRNGIAHRWRLKDLKLLGSFRFSGEGWGLTTLNECLVMSDGTSTLRVFDPATMKVVRRIAVTVGGRPLERINELEAIDGEIWANIWLTDVIARIDPASGKVRSIVDLGALKQLAGPLRYDDVLNGIAWDARGKRLFVTGKNWPKLFEIRITACA